MAAASEVLSRDIGSLGIGGRPASTSSLMFRPQSHLRVSQPSLVRASTLKPLDTARQGLYSKSCCNPTSISTKLRLVSVGALFMYAFTMLIHLSVTF